MSRVGRSPIAVPAGVTVTIDSGHVSGEGARRRAQPRPAYRHHRSARRTRTSWWSGRTTSVTTVRCTV